MRTFSILLLLMTLASVVSADTITDINLWIGVDGHTLVEEKVVIDEAGKTNSEVTIPKYVTDLNIADDLSGKLQYTIKPKDRYDLLNFSFKKIEDGEERVVWVKFGTPHLTKKDGVNWTISYQTLTTPRRTIMRVNFPVGSSFISLKPEKLLRSYDKYAVFIFPQEDYLDFNCTYNYAGNKGQSYNTTTSNMSTNVLTTIAPVPPDNGTLPPASVVIVIVSIIFISGIAYLVFKMELFKKEIKEEKKEPITVSVQKEEDIIKGPNIVGDSLSYDIEGGGAKKGKRKVKESILKMLDDNEMAIVKILEGSEDDEVTQAYIHKTTGIPKSSLSDIIKRLEKRNMLETTSQGRIKWLKLQKWVLE